MKKLVLLLTAISSFAWSAPVIKTGTFIVGYDRELQVTITKTIEIWLNKAGVSEMRIEGEELHSATLEGGKIFGYVVKPKKYFFYSLDLNPKTAPVGDRTLIVAGHPNEGNDLVYRTSYCSEGASALLTAHGGDGTKKTFCVTLKREL